MVFFFFSSRRRHTRFDCDWSSDVCSSDLMAQAERLLIQATLKQCKYQKERTAAVLGISLKTLYNRQGTMRAAKRARRTPSTAEDRKSTRLNSSHSQISYAVFCLKKKTDRTRTAPP